MCTLQLIQIIFSYLNVSIAQSQPGSLEQFSSVLQDFHDGQEVAAVLCSLIRRESQSGNHLSKPVHALAHLCSGDVVL